jgi:hypothetical protein
MKFWIYLVDIHILGSNKKTNKSNKLFFAILSVPPLLPTLMTAVARSTILVLSLVMSAALHPLFGIGVLVIVIRAGGKLVLVIGWTIWMSGTKGRTVRQQSLLFLLSDMWVLAKSNADETLDGGPSLHAGYNACLLVPMTQCSNKNAYKWVSQNVATQHH